MWLSGVGMPYCIRQRQTHALDYSFIITCAVCTDWHWHEAGAKRSSTCSKPCKASRSGFDAERTCKRLRKGVHRFVHQDLVICRQARPCRFLQRSEQLVDLLFKAQGGPRTQGPDPFFRSVAIVAHGVRLGNSGRAGWPRASIDALLSPSRR